jgi:SAM-dependent methyltransferase
MTNTQRAYITSEGPGRVLRLRLAVVISAVLILCTLAIAQGPVDEDAVWKDFIAWFKSTPIDGNPLGAYAAKLEKEGLSKAEAGQRLALVLRLFSERPEGTEVHYDRAYSRPATGNPAEDGFASSPSEFVAEAVKGRKAGAALDVGMGQGRNAVYLAQQGWDVTGFDLSQVGLDAARVNAEKAGVSIRTEKAAYDRFDFGVEKWDLIVIVFAWAPVEDASFVARLRQSLRPGGLVLFEHFIKDADHPYPPMVRAPEPGKLRDYFSEFDIDFYEEKDGIGDWGGPGSRLVRMVARKRS